MKTKNPKFEVRSPKEIRNPKPEPHSSGFGILSGFGFRVSGLLLLSSLFCRAQTTVVFTNQSMIGTTNDTTITIKADNSPIIYNGVFYSLPAAGTNITTTNGVGQVQLVAGSYTASFAGVPASFKLYVTNSATPLNAAAIANQIVFYSGVQSLTAAGGISIYPPNGSGGNWTISNNPASGFDTNGEALAVSNNLAAVLATRAGTNSSALWLGQWLVSTNPADNSLSISNTASKVDAVILRTNGWLDASNNVITNLSGWSMTNNGPYFNYSSAFWRMAPKNWSAGNGLLFEGVSAGGFVLASGDGAATVQVQGHGLANVLVTGTLTAAGNFVEQGSSSLDNGQITTDGNGNLTVVNLSGVVGILSGRFSSDAGSVETDGSGNLMAVSFNGNGTGLMSLNASQLSTGVVPLPQLAPAVVTNRNVGNLTNLSTFVQSGQVVITNNTAAGVLITNPASATAVLISTNGLVNVSSNIAATGWLAQAYTNTSAPGLATNAFYLWNSNGLSSTNSFYLTVNSNNVIKTYHLSFQP